MQLRNRLGTFTLSKHYMLQNGSLELRVSEFNHSLLPGFSDEFYLTANVNGVEQFMNTRSASGQPTVWNEHLNFIVKPGDDIPIALYKSPKLTGAHELIGTSVISLSVYLPQKITTKWSTSTIYLPMSLSNKTVGNLSFMLTFSPPMSGASPTAAEAMGQQPGYDKAAPMPPLYDDVDQAEPFFGSPGYGGGAYQFSSKTKQNDDSSTVISNQPYGDYASPLLSIQTDSAADDTPMNPKMLAKLEEEKAEAEKTPTVLSAEQKLQHTKQIYFSYITPHIDEHQACTKVKGGLQFISAAYIYGAVAAIALVCMSLYIYYISKDRRNYQSFEETSGLINTFTHMLISLPPVIISVFHLHTIASIPKGACVGYIQRAFLFIVLSLNYINFIGTLVCAYMTKLGQTKNYYYSYLMIYCLTLFLIFLLLLITDGEILDLIVAIIGHIFG